MSLPNSVPKNQSCSILKIVFTISTIVYAQKKDVDFGRREIIIREGKGFKDRVTMLPLALATPLKETECSCTCSL